jgi:nucleoside-diphosphate-sugar epimerase
VRALVTGANGHVGRHLVALLRDRGHTVTAAGHAAEVEVDLRFGDDVRALVERESPDLVVHLGGVTDPAELIRDPVTGNQGVVQPAVSVLEAVAQAAPAAPVLLGSCVAVVGRPTVLPVVEKLSSRWSSGPSRSRACSASMSSSRPRNEATSLGSA